jgi:Rrf2 family protein
MKLPEGTEWVLHCAASLAQLADGDAASTAQLATHFGLPPAYLAKHLASLVRAGVLTGTTGPRGGFRLARPAAETTFLDSLAACTLADIIDTLPPEVPDRTRRLLSRESA